MFKTEIPRPLFDFQYALSQKKELRKDRIIIQEARHYLIATIEYEYVRQIFSFFLHTLHNYAYKYKKKHIYEKNVLHSLGYSVSHAIVCKNSKYMYLKEFGWNS